VLVTDFFLAVETYEETVPTNVLEAPDVDENFSYERH
jgi:hypothetical protein